jgi:rod shape-determining protein MreC
VSERRTRWLLVFVLVAQLVLLTAQIRDPEGNGSYLEAGLLRLLAPVAGLVAAASNSVTGLTQDWALRRTLVAENRRLRAEVEDLRERSIRLFGLEEDLEHLSTALDYARGGAPLQVADLVYIDHASWLQTAVVTVAPGSVEVNHPVVSSEGLVGRVVVVAGRHAKVQLITDRAASVGVMIERTHRQGVVRGVGRGGLELDYVSLQADVRVGDSLVTAGIDGVYPRGVPVGTVAAVAPGDDLFHEIRVVPAVDFSRLDQVYVLRQESVPTEVLEGQPNAQP